MRKSQCGAKKITNRRYNGKYDGEYDGKYKAVTRAPIVELDRVGKLGCSEDLVILIDGARNEDSSEELGTKKPSKKQTAQKRMGKKGR